MYDDIKLDKLNRTETLKYLGYGNINADEKTDKLMDLAEEKILEAAKPRYIYKLFDINECEEGVEICGTSLILHGDDIREHLSGCKQAVLFAATVSSDIDNIIKTYSYTDVLMSLVLDCMASVAVEQVGNRFDDMIASKLPDKYLTFRFGVGYGDLPLAQQSEVIAVLDASKRIGITVTKDNIMIPRKSITGIMGISDTPVAKKKQGCVICSMKDICRFRKAGNHCNG